MPTVEDVRSVATGLPRSTEAFVRGRVKFRVGRIVYLAFSRDETELGFAFPKEWRDALVEPEPDKFRLPDELRPPLQLGGRPAWRRSTRPSCASSSSMRGRSSFPNALPPSTPEREEQ